jgi:putative transcriptional regulator
VIRIRLRLRECMDAYEARTGMHVSYADLAAITGLSLSTVQSIGSREQYNATLEVIERLCTALGATPLELLEWHEESGAQANSNSSPSREESADA